MRKVTKICSIYAIALFFFAAIKMVVRAESPSPSPLPHSRIVNTDVGISSDAIAKMGTSNPLQRRGWPKWLQLPDRATLASWQHSRAASACLSGFQVGLLAYLAVEIFNAVREIQKEFSEESSLFGAGADSNQRGANALLTPVTANNLVTWLDTPSAERGPAPKAVPSWMVVLAHDLKVSCHSLSHDDLFRILSQLTKQQALLLQSSLLRPSPHVSFRTIGGLKNVKEGMQRWIATNCLTDETRKVQESSPYKLLVQQGLQGIVLWGAPGCGKSLLMKAVARQAGWPTVVVTPSLLQRKWYGESTNQVRTLFSLFSTLGPCIVVLDELDGLFRSRSQEEHEVSRELKTEWLQWWDGVASSQLSQDHRILVVAATNRPWDVDPAVWRRLPQRFYVGVPTRDDRCDLWQRWSEAYRLPPIDPSVIDFMADRTEGYTPSDLFQILQTSSQKGPMLRLQQDLSDQQLTVEDVQDALQTVPPTRFTPQYIQQIQSFFNPQNQHNAQQHADAQQSGHIVTADNNQSQVWKTPVGNFYQINIPVNPEVFDALHNIWLNQLEWEFSSDDEDYEDESEDGID